MHLNAALLLGCAVALASCGGGPHASRQTPYIDEEFGKNTREAFARQIAYPQGRNVSNAAEGMEGIYAEPVMKRIQKSYSEKTGKDVVIKMGIEK